MRVAIARASRYRRHVGAGYRDEGRGRYVFPDVGRVHMPAAVDDRPNGPTPSSNLEMVARRGGGGARPMLAS